MKLKLLTLLTLGSISFLFVVRTISTFIPGFFMISLVGKSIQVLSFIAHLIILVFYFMFLVDFVQQGQKKLHFASILLVASSTVMSILYLRGVFMAFPGWSSPLYERSPFLFQLLYSPMIPVNLPAIGWINTLFFLFFLISFSSEVKGLENTTLQKVTHHATIGMSILLVLQTILVVMQLFTGGMGWMLPFSFWISALLFPLFMVIYILKFNFFLNFYRIFPD